MEAAGFRVEQGSESLNGSRKETESEKERESSKCVEKDGGNKHHEVQSYCIYLLYYSFFFFLWLSSHYCDSLVRKGSWLFTESRSKFTISADTLMPSIPPLHDFAFSLLFLNSSVCNSYLYVQSCTYATRWTTEESSFLTTLSRGKKEC
jgi:hypothetical protein